MKYIKNLLEFFFVMPQRGRVAYKKTHNAFYYLWHLTNRQLNLNPGLKEVFIKITDDLYQA